MTLQDYINQVRVLVHDQLATDWTDQELTTIVNNARQRVALDSHSVRQFFTSLTTVVNQETYPINGGIGGVLITNPGAGYSVPPTVTFTSPGGGGTTATGTAVISAGAVTQVLMTNWGSGYSTVPTVTFGAGSPTATGTAQALINILDILSISAIWPGGINRQMLDFYVFTQFQAWCRSYGQSFDFPRAWTNFDAINQFFLYPIPPQNYGLEIDAITLPTNLVLLTDVDLQVLYPHADCVQFYAAFIARSKLQDYDKADYLRKMYKDRMMEVQITRQDRRIPSPYRQSYRRMMRR